MQQIKGISRKDGYEIGQSLLFDRQNSSLLRRTGNGVNFSSWVWSGWIKPSCDGKDSALFGKNWTASDNWGSCIITSDGQLKLEEFVTGPNAYAFDSTFRLRDPSAWTHLVIRRVDNSRTEFYLNGVLVESYMAANRVPSQMFAHAQTIGCRRYGGAYQKYYDGYLSEVHFVDDQSLGPEWFGQEDSKGVWIPIPYEHTGTGTNSYYLPFDADDIGADHSGNDNDFTLSGLTSDSVVADSPTNNYCTLNPLSIDLSYGGTAPIVLSGGNLELSATQAGDANSTFGFSSGKWYAEFKWLDDVYPSLAGVKPAGTSEYTDTPRIHVSSGSSIMNNNSVTQNPSPAISTGDTLGVALDSDSRSVQFYRNGWPWGNAESMQGDVKAMSFFLGNGTDRTRSYTANFGQRSWAYEPPSGYKAPCTQNLPYPLVNPKDNFKAVAYSGNGWTQSIDTGFAPDLVWTKSRSISASHGLTDSVRGAGRSMKADDTASERPVSGPPGATDDMYAFTSSGFSVGFDNYLNINQNNVTYASWNFRAGGTAVTNNDGSIPTQVSANRAMGFSVVKWTQNLQQLYTIGHGLGKIPDLIITKKLAGDQRWEVYSTPTGVDNGLVLNDSAASATMNTWGSFQPTDKVFMFTQTTGDYIAYCFTNTEMIQVGSYVGNGLEDGTMVSLPFKPAYLMVKATNYLGQSWWVQDNVRDTYNPETKQLRPNNPNAEIDSPAGIVDFVSNGFKLLSADYAWNGNGESYLYLSISEQPFKYARGR